jgi:hypothetical protein
MRVRTSRLVSVYPPLPSGTARTLASAWLRTFVSSTPISTFAASTPML